MKMTITVNEISRTYKKKSHTVTFASYNTDLSTSIPAGQAEDIINIYVMPYIRTQSCHILDLTMNNQSESWCFTVKNEPYNKLKNKEIEIDLDYDRDELPADEDEEEEE